MRGKEDRLAGGYAITYVKIIGVYERQDNAFEFEYTDNNISRTQITYYASDTSVDDRTYTYGTRENYHAQLTFAPLAFIFDFSLWTAPFWFSENNVIQETRYSTVSSWVGESVYHYIWEDNLLTAIEITGNSHTTTDVFVRSIVLTYGWFLELVRLAFDFSHQAWW